MDRTATQKSDGATLYGAITPFDQRRLAVSGGHEIHVEQCGNPRGLPVLVVHGGPGGGCSPAMRRFFDPARYRVILFDQRGCGRSRPHASVEANTTWDLVADMERIREVLGIDRWTLFGGSWGATLALVYAEAHPGRTAALVLRGVFLGTDEEIDWFYGGGAARFWPREWEAFCGMVPEGERNDLIAAYHERLFCGEHETECRFARAWTDWETALAMLRPANRRVGGAPEYARAFARLENHYFRNRSFLEPDQAILANLDRLRGIPGVIVQGRYDMICPPRQAIRLAAGWPGADLRLVADAGHALSEPGIAGELVAAMDRLSVE